MDDSERDDLLNRLDERSESTIRELVAQNRHLEKINGSLLRHNESISEINTTVYGNKSDKGLCGEVTTQKKILYWAIGIILTGGTISGLELADVIQIIGG